MMTLQLAEFRHLISTDFNPTLLDFSISPGREGEFLYSTGMKASYLGAFTSREIEFIKSFYRRINNPDKNVLVMAHEQDDRGLVSLSDVHLFSGSSDLGTFRIDINEDSNATHVITVQKFLRFCKMNDIKFDMVILDPPYNGRYDRKYGTGRYNNIKEGGLFLEKLLEQIMRVVRRSAIIISKNWRSIRPDKSRFISGIITSYGGYRRYTLLEAWQYLPESGKSFSLGEGVEKGDKVRWVLAGSDKATRTEQEIIGKRMGNGEKCMITRGKGERIAGFDTIVSPEEFIDIDGRSFDLVYLDKCKKVGGSIALTNTIKKKLITLTNAGGTVIAKTYFNPKLESNDGVELENITVLCYEGYDKIDALHVFKIIQKE